MAEDRHGLNYNTGYLSHVREH